MNIEPALLGATLLVLTAVIASKIASRLGIPALLLFLGLGMLVGVDGVGGIDFDDAELARAVGVLALAVILFDGGLSTRWSTVKPVLAPGAVMATVGVVATAAITGSAAVIILDVPAEIGLLLGAIVSSTDAAAVFSVLRSRGTSLTGSARATLELESGANDPMAVFLTLALIELATNASAVWTDFIPVLLAQLGLGLVVGLAAGWLGQQLINRINLGIEGLYPVLTIAFSLCVYAGTTVAGGSGFLAIYVCGLWLGNRDILHQNSITRFHDAAAWLGQIGMFLVLGLLVSPTRLPDVALDALLVVVVLTVVARPLVTIVALTPFRVPYREQAVIGWVGLRGATPIILATFPLVDDVPHSALLFDVVFFVVIASVLLQGTTVTAVSRLFGATAPLSERPPAPLEAGVPLPDGTALRELYVESMSPADGQALIDLHLPERALLVLINRDGTYLVPTGATELTAGDAILLLADDNALAQVRALLHRAPDT